MDSEIPANTLTCRDYINNFFWKNLKVNSNLHLKSAPFFRQVMLFLFRMIVAFWHITYALYSNIHFNLANLKYLT